MRLIRYLLLVFLFCPLFAYGQGSRKDDVATKNLVTGLAAAPGALITVCTSAGVGVPCTPLANIYSDVGLTSLATNGSAANAVSCSIGPTTNPCLADSNGNYGFYANPGRYVVTVTGAGTTGKSVVYTLACDPSAACTVSGTTMLYNINNVQWTGLGATPTIDQAIAAATVPGRVDISPTSTSAEATSNVSTSTAYIVNPAPSPSNRLVVFDNRGSQASAPPMYSVGYGQKCVGEFTTECINYWTTGTIPDSTTTLADNNWIQGTFPSNNGSLQAHSSVTIVHDSVTVGASASAVVGSDAEVWLDATSSDAAIPIATGYNAGILFNRANGTQNALLTRAFHASGAANTGGSAQSTVDAYGFDADGSTVGTQRNFAYHSNGNWMTENNTGFYAGDSGTAYTITASPTGATESGQVVTITTSIVCTLTTGQHVLIAGVGVGGYNGNFIVRSPGCNGGSSFTYFNPGTNNLAGSGAGTATGTTPRLVTNYQTDNTIVYQPLTDAAGWNWKNQGGTLLFSITNTNIQAGRDLVPRLNGGSFLGGSNAWAGLFTNTTATGNGIAGSNYSGYDSTTGTEQHNSNNNGASSFSGAWQCTNVTPVTVSANSTSPQNLMSCSIPAGTLNRVGRTLRIWLSGIYSTPAASTTAVVITVKLGALTVATWTSTALAGIQATNDQWNVTGWITTQTAGASGAFEAHGNMDIDLGVGNTVADSNFADVNTATVGTLDITAAQTLQVTFTTTVGQAAGFSASQRQLIAETIN